LFYKVLYNLAAFPANDLPRHTRHRLNVKLLYTHSLLSNLSYRFCFFSRTVTSVSQCQWLKC